MKKASAPGGTRTPDPQLRRLLGVGCWGTRKLRACEVSPPPFSLPLTQNHARSGSEPEHKPERSLFFGTLVRGDWRCLAVALLTTVLLIAPTHAADLPREREPIGAPYIVPPTPAVRVTGHCVCAGGVVVTVPAMEVAGLTRDCWAVCHPTPAGTRGVP